MPSVSSLFFKRVWLLVARCAKSFGRVLFGHCAAANAANMLFGPLFERMFYAVFGRTYNNKIFYTIIQRVFIFVMHMKSFWGVCYNTMFVFPRIWLRNFYAYIRRPITGFVQAFGAYWELYSYFCKDGLPRGFSTVRERFSGAVRTAWSVVVRVAVSSFSSYDLCAAKRAKFVGKFFRHALVYAKYCRIANAF